MSLTACLTVKLLIVPGLMFSRSPGPYEGNPAAIVFAPVAGTYLKRPGGQSQFSTMLTGQMSGSSSMRDIQSWLSMRFDQPMTLDDMAAQAKMNVRNFTRAFATEFGVTPMAYLEGLRCERAKTLLLDTDLPMKTVAFRSGVRSDEQMRKVFRRRFSLSPRDFRARFRTAGTSMD